MRSNSDSAVTRWLLVCIVAFWTVDNALIGLRIFELASTRGNTNAAASDRSWSGRQRIARRLQVAGERVREGLSRAHAAIKVAIGTVSFQYLITRNEAIDRVSASVLEITTGSRIYKMEDVM